MQMYGSLVSTGSFLGHDMEYQLPIIIILWSLFIIFTITVVHDTTEV